MSPGRGRVEGWRELVGRARAAARGAPRCRAWRAVDPETGEEVELHDELDRLCPAPGGWLYVDCEDPEGRVVGGRSPEEVYEGVLRLRLLSGAEWAEERCARAEAAGDEDERRYYRSLCEEALGWLRENLELLERLREGRLRVEVL